jgi:RNA polymerase sigma-70 factor (ECF subfamily)
MHGRTAASDTGLLARAAAGENAALETLIGRHEARVYGLARAILKNAAWAEDATQETFLRVVQQLPRFSPRQDFDTWILCVARNVALSLWRKRQVRGETGFDNTEALDEPTANDPDTSPLERAIAQESFGRIRLAIDALPGPLREVLVLRFFHELEPAEIARVLDVKPGTARIRLFRALEELRRRLNETDL